MKLESQNRRFKKYFISYLSEKQAILTGLLNFYIKGAEVI